jgi:site-specific DNA recombinase
MKAIGYIRVSTERQAGEGVSLEAQTVKIENWCKANGYELVEVFTDAGISGKSMDKRQGLQKALASVKKDVALVVYSLSRLARSTKDAINIGESISKRKGYLVSLSENLDGTTATGKMMFQMLAVLAEFERNLVGERTQTALAQKKANGEVYTAITPFGYEAIEGRLVKVEAEAQVVTEIQRRRQAGETLQLIADGLNSQGIAGKIGGKWYPSTVRNLIQRKAA